MVNRPSITPAELESLKSRGSRGPESASAGGYAAKSDGAGYADNGKGDQPSTQIRGRQIVKRNDQDVIIDVAYQVLIRRAATADNPGLLQLLHFKPKVEKNKPAQFDWNLEFSHPTVDLTDGWMFARGSNPCLTTPNLTAHGSGTDIVVQIDGAIERVYLLSPFPSTVLVIINGGAGAPTVPQLTQMDYFIEARQVSGNWVIFGPFPADNTYPAQRDFLIDVRKQIPA